MFLEKSGKYQLALLLLVAPNLSLAQDRLNRMSLIDVVEKRQFREILSSKISPNMPPTYRGAVDKLIGSTVAVIGSNSNFGSGVLLTKTDAETLGLIDNFGEGHFIATVDHVVNEPQDYAVIFYEPNGSELDIDAIETAQIIGTRPDKDLAILKISNKPEGAKGSKLVKNNNQASIGDDVQAVGHPNSMWWTYTRGYISQFRENYEWSYEDNGVEMQADVVQTQTPITTGNSGGPLFTQTGEVLGLNAFGDTEFQSINFAISAHELRRFAESLSLISNEHQKISIASIIIPSSQNWQMINEFDLNEDGRVDAVTYDTNEDGSVDLGEFDVDYDGIVDHYEFDLFENNEFALTYYPSTAQYYSEWRVDTDADGTYDLMATDQDQDGIPDRIEAISG